MPTSTAYLRYWYNTSTAADIDTYATTTTTAEIDWRLWTSGTRTTSAAVSNYYLTIENADESWRVWSAPVTAKRYYRNDTYRDVQTSGSFPLPEQIRQHVIEYDRHVRYRPNEEAHVQSWRDHQAIIKRAQELEQRKRARKQSLRLLFDFLTKEQWHQLKYFGFFDVIGSDSKNVYRIHMQRGDSMVANVEVLKDKAQYAANDNWKATQIKAVLCAHPDWQYAIGDQLLTQKLLIENEEKRFLQVANHHEIRNRPRPRRLLKAA